MISGKQEQDLIAHAFKFFRCFHVFLFYKCKDPVRSVYACINCIFLLASARMNLYFQRT